MTFLEIFQCPSDMNHSPCNGSHEQITIYMYIHTFDLQKFITSTECSTLGTNKSCFKKRHLFATKVSCYLQPSGIPSILCSKNNKNICANQYIRSTSSNEIKNMNSSSVFQYQFNLGYTSTNEFVPFI